MTVYKNPKTGKEIELKTPAKHVGVIYNTDWEKVVQVLNPVFEEEFEIEPVVVQPNEIFRLFSKKQYGIEGEMSLSDVYNLTQKIEQGFKLL